MNPSELSSHLRQLARKAGFELIGFANPHHPPPHAAYLEQWLNQGKQASMEWMVTWAEKRMDIFKLYPQVQSVVMVALNYYHPANHSSEPGKGKISRYAWGRDYHKIIKKKLKQLLIKLKERYPQAEGRLFCDTAPVMEKQWAVAAGLGWQGKNTNLLNRNYGSWLFLGGLLLNMPLEPAGQMTDFCGKCRACIEACPTGALEPYRLDAGKCISYRTIENRDSEMDAGIARNLNNWVFGCDICQDVCPWNRRPKLTGEPGFYPAEGNVAPSLDELERLTDGEFRQRFKKSPVYRAGLDGLKRNVKAVKQNSHPESDEFA